MNRTQAQIISTLIRRQYVPMTETTTRNNSPEKWDEIHAAYSADRKSYNKLKLEASKACDLLELIGNKSDLCKEEYRLVNNCFKRLRSILDDEQAKEL